MRVYKAAAGARYSDKQAKALGKVLESLGDKVTPEAVVEQARPKNSPIHNMFQWDDKKAAQAHRVEIARQHIAHLRIEIIAEKSSLTTKAYHNVVINDGGTRTRCYTSMATVRNSAELRQQVIENALSQIEAWQSRYEEYGKVLGPIFAAIKNVRKAVSRGRKKAAA